MVTCVSSEKRKDEENPPTFSMQELLVTDKYAASKDHHIKVNRSHDERYTAENNPIIMYQSAFISVVKPSLTYANQLSGGIFLWCKMERAVDLFTSLSGLSRVGTVG